LASWALSRRAALAAGGGANPRRSPGGSQSRLRRFRQRWPGLATGSPELVVANTAGERGHGHSDPTLLPGRLLQALYARRSRPWVVTRPCSSIAIRWRFPTVWERKRRWRPRVTITASVSPCDSTS